MHRPHIGSEELLAFALDGELLCSATQQHLAHCSLCQSQLSFAQQTILKLLSQVYRSSCPSAEMLSYFCLPGILSESEQRQIAEHVAHCPLCTRELIETRAFLALPQ
jgi:hypothetical protein